MNEKYKKIGVKFFAIGGIIIFFIFPLFIDQFIMNKFETNWEMQTWAGFLGSYLGGAISALITLGGVWWQVRRTEKKENEEKRIGVLRGVLYSLDKNVLDKGEFRKEIEQSKEDIDKESFYIFDYYYTSIIHSKYYSSYIYEIIPEVIKENYKIIFGFDFGEEIIDLYNNIKEFNRNHCFLSEEQWKRNKIIKDIEENIKKEISKIGLDKNELCIENEIINTIDKIKEKSEIFAIDSKKDFPENEILENGRILNKLVYDLINQIDNLVPDLKKGREDLVVYYLSAEILLGNEKNIFKIKEKIKNLREKIKNELKK